MTNGPIPVSHRVLIFLFAGKYFIYRCITVFSICSYKDFLIDRSNDSYFIFGSCLPTKFHFFGLYTTFLLRHKINERNEVFKRVAIF